LGVVLLWAAAHIDYHRLRPLAWPLAGATVVLLVVVLLPHFGVEVNGARRWLRLGPMQMQPAELAKVASIIFMALWLERHRERIGSLEDGGVPFVTVLIILERDLGTTLIVAGILLSQFLVAGGRKRHVLLLLLIVGLCLYVFIRMEPYRLHRILA